MTEDTNGDDRNRMPCLNELLDACARHTLSEQVAGEIANEGDQRGQIVIREAYIPYIPLQWNRYLVLAEAQNLANANDAYVQWLLGLSSQERMNRFSDGPAVGPWDDGSLPCAIEAAFRWNSCETAVSNAVPWSRTNPDGNNENPSEALEDKAVQFWEDLLPLIQPTHIITAGKVAERVLEKAIEKVLERTPNMSFHQLSVRLPSPLPMSLISGMFNADDLLKRYPEVHRVVQSKPEWFQTYKRNKVFFACHVVSLYGQNCQGSVIR